MSQVEPIREFDAKGRLIYRRHSDGYEYWQEFDANGNEIHYRNSTGYEIWREYDANGNLIHYCNSSGIDVWYWGVEQTQDPIQILLLQHNLRQNATSIS